MLVNAPGVVNTNRINGLPFLVDSSISSNRVSLAFLNGSAIDGESWSTFIGGEATHGAVGKMASNRFANIEGVNNTGVVKFQGNSHSFQANDTIVMGGLVCDSSSSNLINGNKFVVGNAGPSTITLEAFAGNYENCTAMPEGMIITSLRSSNDVPWDIIEFESSISALNEFTLRVNTTSQEPEDILREGDIVVLTNVHNRSLDSIAGRRYAVSSVSYLNGSTTLKLFNPDVSSNIVLEGGGVGKLHRLNAEPPRKLVPTSFFLDGEKGVTVGMRSHPFANGDKVMVHNVSGKGVATPFINYKNSAEWYCERDRG